MTWALAIATLSQLLLPLAHARTAAARPVRRRDRDVGVRSRVQHHAGQLAAAPRSRPPSSADANATLKTVVWGTLPVGTLLGGALGNPAGIVPTLIAGAVVSACAIPWLLGSGDPRARDANRRASPQERA